MKLALALGVLLVSDVAGADASADGDMHGCKTPKGVIETIQRLKKHAAPHKCEVDKCLYSVITTAGNHERPYGPGFGKAWVAGYDTIQEVVRFFEADPSTATKKALQLIGFGDGPYDKLGKLSYYVFDGCELQENTPGLQIVPHSALVWRDVLTKMNIAVREEVWATLANYTWNFEALTKCDRNCVMDDNTDLLQTDTKCGCAKEFAEAMKVVAGLNPYNKRQTSAKCFSRFNKAFPNATALQLRAALWQCQDVNPYNSFVGFTYNGQDLLKAEYITENFSFHAARSRNVTIAYEPIAA